jgi:PIN domain nuclease of toxin-antitoxin system
VKLLLDTHTFLWWLSSPNQLPLHHRDPFDRILIAQAQLERATLVTRDPQFPAYNLPQILA